MAGTRIIAEYLYPYLRSNVWGAFELATRRHACATLLAIRLFELDHGRVPTTLDELVPTYLPEVPRDLTRAGAPPLTYVNDNGIVGIWISDPRHPTSRPATQPADFRPGGRTRQHLMVVYRGHERWRNLATGSARR
jgi:hypothetical protein